MNLMDLKGEHQTFLSQEDQDEHNLSQFQTKSGESFDFKQGYDTAVYEVHKQYKLRTRTIDISEPSKPKDGKQPNKIKSKAVITEPVDTNVPNPHQVTVEDITEAQPSVDQLCHLLPLSKTRTTFQKSLLKLKNRKQSIPITLINKSKQQIIQMKQKKLPLSTPRLHWKIHLI